MRKIEYDITPCPKPRMTQRDKWAKRPSVLRYRAFCDHCRLLGVHIHAEGTAIEFVLPMPNSWSQKKRDQMDGQPHQSKPDLSNLLKAIEDAVCEEDSHIWHYSKLSKTWGQAGKIIISRSG